MSASASWPSAPILADIPPLELAKKGLRAPSSRQSTKQHSSSDWREFVGAERSDDSKQKRSDRDARAAARAKTIRDMAQLVANKQATPLAVLKYRSDVGGRRGTNRCAPARQRRGQRRCRRPPRPKRIPSQPIYHQPDDFDQEKPDQAARPPAPKQGRCDDDQSSLRTRREKSDPGRRRPWPTSTPRADGFGKLKARADILYAASASPATKKNACCRVAGRQAGLRNGRPSQAVARRGGPPRPSSASRTRPKSSPAPSARKQRMGNYFASQSNA